MVSNAIYVHCNIQSILSASLLCSSRLEWTVSQWGGYLESAAQLQRWLEAVEAEVCAPLTPQLGPREKASQLGRLRALQAELEDHQVALASLEEKAAELHKKTGDSNFNQGARSEIQAQFDDLSTLVEVRWRLGFWDSECVCGWDYCIDVMV